jgi:hypothetical protein
MNRLVLPLLLILAACDHLPPVAPGTPAPVALKCGADIQSNETAHTTEIVVASVGVAGGVTGIAIENQHNLQTASNVGFVSSLVALVVGVAIDIFWGHKSSVQYVSDGCTAYTGPVPYPMVESTPSGAP